MKQRMLAKIFALGIALTSKMTFATKFMVLGVVALLAVCTTLYNPYVNEREIVRAANNELDGLVLIELHAKAIQLLQQHRGLSFAVDVGLHELDSQLADNERAVTAAYSLFQNRLSVTARSLELLKRSTGRWIDILENGKQWQPQVNFTAHTQLLEDMFEMQTVLADDYGLTADPELGSYYLAHVATVEMLNTLEQFAQFRGYGTSILSEKKITDQQRVKIGALTTELADKLKALKINIGKAGQYNPELQNQLSAEYTRLEQSAQWVLSTINDDILTRRFFTEPVRYFNRLTEIIDHGYAQMYQVLIPAARRTILARANRVSSMLYSSAIMAGLILTAVAYFMASIYFATVGSVNALSRSVADYARGNMKARVQLETHDELLSVGESFNNMADELTTLMAARADAAQHTQAILDNMVDALITIDERGTISSFNPAATRIFGYAVDEVMGKNIKSLMPSPHRDNHDGYMRNYQTTRTARIIGIGREVEGQRKDGSLFPMDLAISEVSYQGRPMYVGLLRDITERKRADRLKAEFVSTVSHELRTPLTAIAGALGLMSSGVLSEIPTQVRPLVDVASRNSQRLGQLINDLLDMEKLVAGKMHFESQLQPLTPLIVQAIESCRHYGSDRRVILALVNTLAANVFVLVDGQRLIQALANLLSNAIKYSPEGGTVDVSLQIIHDTARVTVVDCGPGIPAEFHSRIFQKFSQADSSDTRQKGGTGLGLAITRELVERMGGKIGFDSVEGHGAKFYIDLPLRHLDEVSKSVA